VVKSQVGDGVSVFGIEAMELLRLLKRAITTKWPEEEVWKLMKQHRRFIIPNMYRHLQK